MDQYEEFDTIGTTRCATCGGRMEKRIDLCTCKERCIECRYITDRNGYGHKEYCSRMKVELWRGISRKDFTVSQTEEYNYGTDRGYIIVCTKYETAKMLEEVLDKLFEEYIH